MKIEAVDFFYLAMPEVLDIGDGSQDTLLVRVSSGGWVGWGECEASPLVSIAGLVAPMSHSACLGVQESLLGQRLESVEDIQRIGRLVRERSRDLLQRDHILSGVDIAMWDLLGRKRNEPVYSLLGYSSSFPKQAYASLLFGDEPEDTRRRAEEVVGAGLRAAKFGWGPYGHRGVGEDRDQVFAAREGLGPDCRLFVDAGGVWGEDVEEAGKRLRALHECGIEFLEEPFDYESVDAYRDLSERNGDLSLAGGEGSHNFDMAKSLIDRGGIDYIQIDTGRIGGLMVAKRVAEHADSKDVSYINHTFTSYLALSASLQPFAGLEHHRLCEYPFEAKPLARNLTKERLDPDSNGEIRAPQCPGLGLTPDTDRLANYLVDVEIRVRGRVIYQTPSFD